MYAVSFLVSFFACVFGKICGMGGGVIIKPVLDATGIFGVSVINFLSGCTVIGMTLWSVGKSVIGGRSQIDWSVSSFLAVGAALGGLLGKQIYAAVSGLFNSSDTAGGVQAALLLLATAATLLYTLNRKKITRKPVENKAACFLIGLALGILGAFLGIGGGPFNMAALYYFFSMSTKIAAQNSLYIILISQVASLASTIAQRSVPSVSKWIVIGMILMGVAGGEIGGIINNQLSEKGAARTFIFAMILVMAVSCYNIIQFFAI